MTAKFKPIYVKHDILLNDNAFCRSVADLLLASDFDVNFTSKSSRRTLLHVAAK